MNTKTAKRRLPADPSTRMMSPRNAIIAAVVLATILAWALWPSPYSKVRNLESQGSAIISFGDSLTAGFGAPAGEDYPSRLSQLIGVPILNAGVNGETTQGALARLDRDVLAHNPRVVIVGLGGNDFLRGTTISETETNLRTIVRRIQEAGAMVVVLGFAFPTLRARYDEMYERVATEEGCLLVGDTLDGILSDPSLKSDQIHPNGRGYEVMAQRVSGPFTKLLRKADAAR